MVLGKDLEKVTRSTLRRPIAGKNRPEIVATRTRSHPISNLNPNN